MQEGGTQEPGTGHPPLGRGYLRLWTAATISNLGDGVILAAMPLLAASLTRDPTKIGLVALAGTLPWSLFALLGGVVADRADRRYAMAAADLFRTIVVGALALAVVLDAHSLVLLGGAVFLLGCAEVVFDNSSQSILPSIVPRDALEQANSRLYAGEIVTNQFAGPPLGSLLFAVTAALPFFVDAASFAIAAVLVLTMRGSFRATRSGARRPVRVEISDGLRWLWRHRLLRTLALGLGAWNLLEAAVLAPFVLYALEVLHLSKAEYGLLLTSGALGALVGSLAAGRLARRFGGGSVALAAAAISGPVVAIPALWANPYAVGLSFALTAALAICWNVVTVSLRQSIVPDELLGRVNSAYRLFGWGTMPLGALAGGLLASNFGLRAPFWFGGVGVAVLAILIAPVVNRRGFDAARSAVAPSAPRPGDMPA